MIVPEVTDWQAEFDSAYAAMAETVQRRVWREVYGDEHPDGIIFYSYISRGELDRCAQELRVGAGEVFGDFGCGQGGPGLWLASRTGARYVGVDISSVALDTARAQASALGVAERAELRQGSFEASGLDTGSLDAVLTVDSLMFAPDKAAAAGELARVLRPGGRLVATTFDYDSRPAGRPPQVRDHRPVLAAAGFDVLTYAETDDWRHRVTSIADRLLAATAELAAESGENPAQLHEELTELRATVDHMRRRVFIVAERR